MQLHMRIHNTSAAGNYSDEIFNRPGIAMARIKMPARLKQATHTNLLAEYASASSHNSSDCPRDWGGEVPQQLAAGVCQLVFHIVST